MNVEVFSENEKDEDELDDDAFVDFVDQKRNKSTHDGVNCYGLDSIVKNLLNLDFLLKTLLDDLFYLFF